MLFRYLFSTPYITKTCTLNKLNRTLSTLPQLSSEKYGVKRKEFGVLKNDDVKFFQSLISKERVLTDESELLPYNIDWIKNCRGQSKVVLKPKTTEEVSQILKYCNERRLAVCPQGGNTGLVGGSVPVFDEVIINFMLMNKIISVDELSGALVCEAGCILENLDNYARERNLIMPLDLGAKGSCQIGGNISTNAGGIRLLRYGNLQGTVLGVEAVKADGSIIDCLRTLKKDNTGYHLKHLFIGSEGTLGVVTKVAIQCPSLPKSVNLGFFGVESFDSVLQLYKSAKSSLGEILSAFEMADSLSIGTTVKNLKLTNPIGEYPFYVLIETHGSDEEHDSDKLSRFLSREMDSGLIVDGTVTAEETKMKSIWNIRESIAGAALHGGYMFKYDVSVPLRSYYELVHVLRRRLRAVDCKVYGYGHVGDGNIHINVVVPEYSKEVYGLLEPFIFEEVSKHKGSISAEHGVGFRKPQYIHYSKDQTSLQLMRDMKRVMDPNGILNPYKVLPDPS
ncbi:D-2-hydroxyglutarate dehydrogenase, mitochondrial [Aricia agestis]|uniref:D-2-hydroxyglutarate dehydrogenase, mitochondrial n=1 Tax=Aricia agestis TaxID=91739 RepID=UPI001C205D59|nr:D-2-hydroxyglutarate dehydrogenase, mitochondrial [Aricia agestis]